MFKLKGKAKYQFTSDMIGKVLVYYSHSDKIYEITGYNALTERYYLNNSKTTYIEIYDLIKSLIENRITIYNSKEEANVQIKKEV